MNRINRIKVPLEERQKRMAVYTKPRQTVLIKFLGVLPGLEEKRRDEIAIDQKHSEEAQKRGLDFQAYRDKGDTGHSPVQREKIVAIHGLQQQLKDLGLDFVGGHWQERDGKSPVSTLQFSSAGNAVPLPRKIQEVLRSPVPFADCTVWCNLKFAPEGGQFRLDTINLGHRLPLAY